MRTPWAILTGRPRKNSITILTGSEGANKIGNRSTKKRKSKQTKAKQCVGISVTREEKQLVNDMVRHKNKNEFKYWGGFRTQQ